MTIEEVTTWLRGVEDLACSAYAEAAGADDSPAELSSFLTRLSQDEALHYHLMGSAAEFLRSHYKAMQSAVLLDQETKERIEAPLRHLHTMIQQQKPGRRLIIEAVIKAETSEWNDIFLYVINTCAEFSPAFQHMAATIQAHEKRIERFVSDMSEYSDLTGKLSSLPGIWEKRLLVVDDDTAFRALLARALGRYGTVTAVADGEAALGHIRKGFFDVVVSDVNMPVRDGISLLREAIHENEVWRSHFIICTGNASREVREATEQYGVALLNKPMSMRQLWDTVETVLRTVPDVDARP